MEIINPAARLRYLDSNPVCTRYVWNVNSYLKLENVVVGVIEQTTSVKLEDFYAFIVPIP